LHLGILTDFSMCACVCADCLADVVYMMDSSISINTNAPGNWALAQTFVDLIIQNLPFGAGGALHGVVQYGNVAYNQFFLGAYTTNKQALTDAIDALTYYTDQQQTNTQSAINRMWTDQFIVAMGDRPNVPNYGIVITDGQADIFTQNTIPESLLAKNVDFVIAVGLGTNVNGFELQAVSSWQLTGGKHELDVVARHQLDRNGRALRCQQDLSW
jgi:collagen type VI alpha